MSGGRISFPPFLAGFSIFHLSLSLAHTVVPQLVAIYSRISRRRVLPDAATALCRCERPPPRSFATLSPTWRL